MKLQIRIVGSKHLRKKTKPINKLSENLEILISNMKDTLSSTNGVGLSSPQIGSNKRIFIVSYGDFEQTFINPIIRESGGEVIEEAESCLSIPNRAVKVRRPDIIKMEFYDEDMKFQVGNFKGFLSRIIQHEYDHLEGKLIIDYL